MRTSGLALILGIVPLITGALPVGDPWVVYEGGAGPGEGKHIVLVSGDEEYRSEEALPQLGKILARHHGFRCTVLFAIDKETGEINPDVQDNIPGLEALKTADLAVFLIRFRNLPPEQARHIDDYLQSGRPVIGIRPTVAGFKYGKTGGPYAKWDFRSKVKGFEGGFGRQILGETWIAHHGKHGRQSTRGVIAPDAKDHPIVRGCEEIWGPTDVYRVRLPMLEGCRPLVLGQVLEGMKPSDKPVEGKQNDPMMPLAWTRTYTAAGGKSGRVFTTTIGASQDFASEGLRRLVVNACYWAVGLEAKIPARTKVDCVGEYRPTPFGFKKFKKGVKPEDHALTP
jgi:type 1 glutamine amidotransferase